LASVAESSRTAHCAAGGHQGSVGNVEEQTFLLASSNPSFRLTREESHFASLKCYSPQGRTPRSHLNSAVPQHHRENMFLLNQQIRFSD